MTPSNTPNDREVLVCCEGANAAISLIRDLRDVGGVAWEMRVVAELSRRNDREGIRQL